MAEPVEGDNFVQREERLGENLPKPNHHDLSRTELEKIDQELKASFRSEGMEKPGPVRSEGMGEFGPIHVTSRSDGMEGFGQLDRIHATPRNEGMELVAQAGQLQAPTDKADVLRQGVEGARQAAQEGHLNVRIDFNDEKYNADGQKGHSFKNQDFSDMPAGLFNSAVREAEALMKLAQERHIDLHNTAIGQVVEGLDASGQHKVTKDALAAALLASDMSPDNATGLRLGNAPPNVISTFHNEVTVDLKVPAKAGVDVTHIRPGDGDLQANDPRIIFAEAQQILKNARPEEVPEGTAPTPGTTANTIANHTYTSAKC